MPQTSTSESNGKHSRMVARAVLTVCCLAGLARIVYVLAAPLGDVIFRLTDDSYYYFQIARNIAAGNGVTFDQINTTNGFHPLWMICLLPIYFLCGDNAETSLRAVQCLVTFFACATAYVTYRCVVSFLGRSAAIVALFTLSTPVVAIAMVNGLETGLLMLLLFLMCWRVRTDDLLSLSAGVARDMLLGLLLASIFLCRLDMIFVVASVVALVVVRAVVKPIGQRSWALILRKLLVVGGTAGVLVAPYLAWNYLNYGHIVPISGALKSTFPIVSFRLSELFWWEAVIGEGLLLFISALMVWSLSKPRGTNAEGERRLRVRIGTPNDILLAMWIGCLLHFANTVLFMNWAVHWWHYAGYAPLAVLCSAFAFARISRASHNWPHAAVYTVAGIAVLAAVGWYIEAAVRGKHHLPWYDAALWAAQRLPDEAVVGMTDCGLFGYFCERRTVNLDGVVNGYEFQAALRDNRLTNYLQECGVTHIADYEVAYTNGDYVIPLPSHLHKHVGGAIVARPEAEIYRSDPYQHVSGRARRVHFAIFDRRWVDVFDDAGEMKNARRKRALRLRGGGR